MKWAFPLRNNYLPMSNKPRIIAIVGPTASGKTSLAIELAQQLNTEIISADSRQFYKELPIGSAMPSEEELQKVKHHFIACRSVTDEYAAGSFARDARIVIDKLLAEKEQVIVCGGSGLYIQALLYGMDEFPEVTQDAKLQVESLSEKGIEALQQVLLELDPNYYEEVDIHNTARLRRALEVCFSSGKPYSSFRTESKESPLPFMAFGIDIPKQELHARIHTRVDEMISNGLEKEARNVYPHRHLKALQTVGYKEYFDYFDGNISQQECVELIKTHTRQYAKRQMTWFNRQLPVEWIHPQKLTKEIQMKIDKQ